MNRDFSKVKAAADAFVSRANGELLEENEEIELEVEASLPPEEVMVERRNPCLE